jgi:hypothetical protein
MWGSSTKLHGKWGRGILLQQENARPHGSQQTIATLGVLGYTVLPHPPYSLESALSDCALFDASKDVMRGKAFTSNDELQAVDQQWHRDTPKEWFAVQIRKLQERWQRCIDIGWNTSNIICMYFVPVNGYCEEKNHLVSIMFERL